MRDRDYVLYLKEKFPDAETGTRIMFTGWAIGESVWEKLDTGWRKVEIRTDTDQ